MRLLQSFLALPPSLLLLLASTASLSHATDDDQSPAQWPQNRPEYVKYFPEDPPHRRRDLEEIEGHILAGHIPVAVKKMSADEGEKFFPEYWGFQDYGNQHAMFEGLGGSTPKNALQKDFEDEEATILVNASAPLSFRPAFPMHRTQETSLDQQDTASIAALGIRNAAAALAILEKRNFQCPSGTSPCSNIAASNLCCAIGEVCFTIPDTGLGTVGCCPSGASCSGSISCAADNLGCPSNIGGGCCIPGYVCAGIGCIPQAVTVATTVTQIVSSSSPTTVVITSVILPVQTSTTTSIIPPSTTTTTTTTTSSSTSSDTNTALQTTLSCACGFQACPLDLGGGCCPTSLACGSGNLCISGTPGPNSTSTGSCPATTTTTTSATPSAPVRATSASDTSTTTAPLVTDGTCPTGFYACSAYYAGGCCRTGRDCATTSCPVTASTTIISSGVTLVVALTGAATTTASPSCATGWTSCAASLGGDCCPSGWSCGTASCTSVSATSTNTEPKEGILLGGACSGRGSARMRMGLAVTAVLFVVLW